MIHRKMEMLQSAESTRAEVQFIEKGTFSFCQHNTTQNTKHKTQNTKHKTQHNTTQLNSTQHNTTQHNTTQHNTQHSSFSEFVVFVWFFVLS
jgi:hypothetical protein